MWNQVKVDPRSYEECQVNPWPRDTGATLYQLSYVYEIVMYMK